MVVIRITCVELFMSISFWKILYGTAKSVILLGLSRILQEKKVKYIYQQIWFNVLRFLNVFIQCWNLNYFVCNFPVQFKLISFNDDLNIYTDIFNQISFCGQNWSSAWPLSTMAVQATGVQVSSFSQLTTCGSYLLDKLLFRQVRGLRPDQELCCKGSQKKEMPSEMSTRGTQGLGVLLNRFSQS